MILHTADAPAAIDIGGGLWQIGRSMTARYPGIARACFHLNWIFLAFWGLYLLGPDATGVLPLDRHGPAYALLAGGLFLIYSLYYALTEGIGRALITDLVPAPLRATAMGTYATATGVVLLPASVIAGALWDGVGPRAPFAFGAALAGLAAVLLVMLSSSLTTRSEAS